MVIDASCIKSLGRAHQLPLSSKGKKKRLHFCIPSGERPSFSPISFNSSLCDPGSSRELCQRALEGGGEGASFPVSLNKSQTNVGAEGAARLRPARPASRVCARRAVRKRSDPVRFWGGTHLALTQDICGAGVWILADDLILLLCPGGRSKRRQGARCSASLGCPWWGDIGCTLEKNTPESAAQQFFALFQFFSFNFAHRFLYHSGTAAFSVLINPRGPSCRHKVLGTRCQGAVDPRRQWAPPKPGKVT